MRRRPAWLYGILLAAITSAASQSLSAADSQVRSWTDGDYRYIEGNGIPAHATGAFPNPGNPNTISEQRHRFRMPLSPQRAAQTTPLGMHPFGIARNGVPFDPGAAEYWNDDRQSGWQYEALSGFLDLGLDQHHAHVQPSGAYHYHGDPTGVEGPLLGYAADGFPIYRAGDGRIPGRPSYRLKNGTRPNGPGGTYDGRFVQDYEFVPGSGDLDTCNGHVGATDEYPDGTYYYVITTTFPFVPRCFVGTPDPSFLRTAGPPPRATPDRPNLPTGPGMPPHGHPPPSDGHPPPRHGPPPPPH